MTHPDHLTAPADLASLLSTEPPEHREYGHHPDCAIYTPEARGLALADCSCGFAANRRALDSAAERIKGLEGVLRAIRTSLTRKVQPEVELWNTINEYVAACGGSTGPATAGSGRRMDAVAAVGRAHRMIPDSIISLINETLDPHQPWCRDDGHSGACQADPEDRGGDE